LNYLGYAYARGGQFHKAIERHLEGIRILRKLGYKFSLVEALVYLSETYYRAGKFDNAMKAAQEALDLAAELKAKRYHALAAWNLGLVYEKQEDYAQAAALMQILVDYEREIGHTDAEKHAKRLAQVREKARGSGK